MCVCVLMFVSGLSLASIVDGGFGCSEDFGSGRAHVQLCQGELVHEVRQLKEGYIMIIMTKKYKN